MIHYGFTGTRHGMTIEQHRVLAKIMLCAYKTNEEVRWHHGLCIGADKQCHDLAKKTFDFSIKGHPPRNRKYTASIPNIEFNALALPGDYLERNRNIVDESDYVVATPYTDQEVHRSGTWATVRYAVSQGKNITVIYPNGVTEKR